MGWVKGSDRNFEASQVMRLMFITRFMRVGSLAAQLPKHPANRLTIARESARVDVQERSGSGPEARTWG